ncbi:MAG: CAP domain-containing protein [Hyphomicrobium sp.]|nr:CAP domain-containing protein [Hyphomicrobium sp.]
MTAARALIALLVTSLACPAPCLAAAASIEPDSNIPARILALHNRERAAVGAPPLAWDPALAASAASYGPTLASLGRLAHSPRETRPGQRENLAMGTAGHYGAEDLVGFWIEEKRHFQPGTFPNVSRTGQWKDVAHYTQMIWKGTTNVGCALHVAGGRNYLICRYSPPGNADGRPVF